MLSINGIAFALYRVTPLENVGSYGIFVTDELDRLVGILTGTQAMTVEYFNEETYREMKLVSVHRNSNTADFTAYFEAKKDLHETVFVVVGEESVRAFSEMEDAVLVAGASEVHSVQVE